MSDPIAGLVASIGATLAADSDVSTAFGGAAVTVYDIEPATGIDARPYPFITIGETQDIDAESGCSTDVGAVITLHVWTQDDSMTRCRAITHAVGQALYRNVLATGWRVVIVQREDSRVMRDPDPRVQHGVVTFRFELEPAA